MKITKLATAVVEANLHWTYVRVYTDDAAGLHGTGECLFAPGLPGILAEFSSVLVGEDPLYVERVVLDCHAEGGLGALSPCCNPRVRPGRDRRIRNSGTLTSSPKPPSARGRWRRSGPR